MTGLGTAFGNALHGVFQRLIAFALILQIGIGPLVLSPATARAQALPPEESRFEDSDPTQPASEQEAIRDAEDLREVIEGESDRVRLRLDTYGFYDLLADPEFAKSRTTVPHSAVRLQVREDSRFELSFRNRKILESRFKVKASGIFGDFLVFIEEGAHLNSIPEQDRELAGNSRGIQHVSFIDLKQYSLMFGRTGSTPPIFTLPVAVTSEVTGVAPAADGIVLLSGEGGEARVPAEVFEIWSRKIYGLAIDVTARLLEPGTYATIGGVVEELEHYFKDAMDEAAMIDGPEQLRAAQEIRTQLVQRVKQHRFNIDELKKDTGVQAGIVQTSRALISQKKIATRIRLLWQRMSFPAPIESARTVKESLALAAYGLTHSRASGGGAPAVKEASLQLLDHKYAKIAIRAGVPIAAAAMLGTAYPREFSEFTYQALTHGSTVLHGAVGFTRNLFDLGLDSVVETLKGLNPSNFYQAYLAGGKASKFAVGVSAIFASGVAIMATPLVVVNSWMLARDLKRKGKMSVEGFIERQQEQLAAYLRVQAETQKKLSARFGAETNTEFTTADTEEVKRILAEIKERDRGVLWRTLDRAKAKATAIRQGFTERVSEWRVFRKKTWDEPSRVEEPAPPVEENVPSSESPVGEDLHAYDTIARERIHGFGSALRSFLISYPSITDGFSALVRGWDGFTIFRRIFWSPTLWVIQTLYPNFSNVALGDGSSRELNIPSRANGGLDPTPRAMKRVFQFLTMGSNLSLIRAWEHKILPIERALFQEAMSQGFSALVDRVRAEGGDLRSVFQNVTSLTDSRFQELSWRHRVFFMRYVESLTARGLQKLLTQTLQSSGDSHWVDPELEELDIQELKKRTLTLIDQVKIDKDTAQRLVQEAMAEGKALEDAKQAAGNFRPKQILDRLRLGALGIVDPKNSPSFRRIQVVLEMMQKPESMPRAVRATLSSLVMAKFLGVGMTLVALSGMHGSILQPFYPEAMFGPNSYFYMGRYAFVNGILMGLGTGMLANAWVKLQQDANHADHFGEVPEGADAKKSYLKWFFKQSFKNPENTFWGNQKTYWSIVWGNMKPAFVLALFTNLIGLGRFDLDGYIAGYLLTFGILNSGFNMMLEQGSEFASYYPLKDFPERLRSHPHVQEYLARKQQTYRFYFALFEKTFVDLQELIIANFERMGAALSSATYKNEAFSRLLFGGFTPTELVYSGTQWLKEKTFGIPLLGAAAGAIGDTCERLLMKDYTSWDKVKGPGGGGGSNTPQAPTHGH